MFGRKKKTGKSSVSKTSESQRPLDDLVDIVPPTPQTDTLLRPLEPRIMLDAALTDTLTDAQAVIDTTDFVSRAQELAQVDRQNADLMQGFVPPAFINPRVGGVSVKDNVETALALQSSELQQGSADPSSTEDDPAKLADNGNTVTVNGNTPAVVSITLVQDVNENGLIDAGDEVTLKFLAAAVPDSSADALTARFIPSSGTTEVQFTKNENNEYTWNGTADEQLIKSKLAVITDTDNNLIATLTMPTAPLVDVNTGITVQESDQGATPLAISSDELQAIDPDDGDSPVPENLTYTLTGVPTHGALTLTRNGEELSLAVGGTFTQADINAGALKYTPEAAEDRAYLTENFKFTLADADGLSTEEQTFAIYVDPVGLRTELINDTALTSATEGGAPVLEAFDSFGRAVTSIGDLNNDGVDDYAVGAHAHDSGGAAIIWRVICDAISKCLNVKNKSPRRNSEACMKRRSGCGSSRPLMAWYTTLMSRCSRAVGSMLIEFWLIWPM